MLRYIKGTVMLILLLSIVGCMKSLGLDPGDDETVRPSDKVQQKEQIEITDENDNYLFLDRKSLEKGIMAGLNIEAGMTFDDVEKHYGKALDSDFLAGGKYNLYETDAYQILLFDVDEGLVKHVILYPKGDIKLQDVREILGEAEFEGLSEMDGTWSFVYYFGTYSFFVDGQTEDGNGLVRRFFLKYEQ